MGYRNPLTTLPASSITGNFPRFAFALSGGFYAVGWADLGAVSEALVWVITNPLPPRVNYEGVAVAGAGATAVIATGLTPPFGGRVLYYPTTDSAGNGLTLKVDAVGTLSVVHGAFVPGTQVNLGSVDYAA